MAAIKIVVVCASGKKILKYLLALFQSANVRALSLLESQEALMIC